MRNQIRRKAIHILNVTYLFHARDELKHVTLDDGSIPILVPFRLHKIEGLILLVEMNEVDPTIIGPIRHAFNEVRNWPVSQLRRGKGGQRPCDECFLSLCRIFVVSVVRKIDLAIEVFLKIPGNLRHMKLRHGRSLYSDARFYIRAL